MGFRLGLAQCAHPANGDVLSMVRAWCERAVAADVDLLAFPESLMTPFDVSAQEMAQAAELLDGPFCTAMDALAREFGLWMLYTANERGEDGCKPFNTAVLVDSSGTKRGVYRKVHLFDTDFVRESDKVVAGSEFMVPVDAPFGRIGVGICYDLRFPELARSAALSGADLLVYPAAWVDGPRKVDQWRTLLAARAIENGIYVAGLSRCDRAFGGAARDYAGNSCVFGPLGETVAQARGVEEELVVADIDLEAIVRVRAGMPSLAHRRPEVYA